MNHSIQRWNYFVCSFFICFGFNFTIWIRLQKDGKKEVAKEKDDLFCKNPIPRSTLTSSVYSESCQKPIIQSMNEISKKKYTHSIHCLHWQWKRKDEEWWKKEKFTFTSICAISTFIEYSSLFFRLVHFPCVSYELPTANSNVLCICLFIFLLLF